MSTAGAIGTSLFEFFKIGPGPSSSHTIGPMKAGHHFIQTVRSLPGDILRQARRIEVRLFGSLSATGRGHGTDRAVLAGLLGHEPETCPSDVLDGLLATDGVRYDLDLGPTTLTMARDGIVFDGLEHGFPYRNTLVIRLMGGEGTLFEEEYYSVGGGFLEWKGFREPERGAPVFPYTCMAEANELLLTRHLRLHELMLENEKAITGMTEEQVYARLDRVLKAMEESVERGIEAEGILPGPIGLHREAPTLYRKALKEPHAADRFMILLSAYSIAAAEENAAGHRIVTAPTAGSSGVMPGILYIMKHQLRMPAQILRQGFLAAAVVGFLAKHNASISGAEVGCQGEVGVASSMAAAMLAYAHDYGFKVTEDAAEIALEHHFGLTCDPVGGYVQIPCIERNAMGAVKAYNAFLLARDEIPEWHVVDLDKAIWVMGETGKDMCSKYKETAEGGLALCITAC